jgi:hypothetical protein
MGSLFTNGEKIKDVIGYDSYNGISHKFHGFFFILQLWAYLFNLWENWTYNNLAMGNQLFLA